MYSNLNPRSISALPGKTVKIRFLISDVFAGDITLCRGPNVAREIRVERACVHSFIHSFIHFAVCLTTASSKWSSP
jgi:hypothetical protein